MTAANDMRPSAPDSARLVAVIREQCAAEVADLIAQAEARAQRVRAEAEAEAQTIRDAARREGEERGRRRAAEIVALAHAASHRTWLAAREQLIDAAIGQAWLELAGFAKLPDATQILAALVHEALGVLPPGPVRVQIPEGYGRILNEVECQLVVPDGHSVRVEKAAIPDGVIVETEDGRLRVDNSFAARAGRRKDSLRRLVAEVLFADAAPAEHP